MQTVLIRIILICKALFFIGKAVTLNLLEGPVYGHIKAKKGGKPRVRQDSNHLPPVVGQHSATRTVDTTLNL